VARVNTAVNQSLVDAEVKDKLARLGIEPVGSTPAQLGQMVAADGGIIVDRKIAKWHTPNRSSCSRAAARSPGMQARFRRGLI
jgi:hypothetical protein